MTKLNILPSMDTPNNYILTEINEILVSDSRCQNTMTAINIIMKMKVYIYNDYKLTSGLWQ